MLYSRRVAYIFTLLALIPLAHVIATWSKSHTQHPWIVPTLFYGLWMIASIGLFLRKGDLKKMFRKSQTMSVWLVIPFAFAVIAFINIFVPNVGLFTFDWMLLANVVICVCNPFIEEIYWRGLPAAYVKNKWIQYIIASVGFAASHPLILGVNSVGASGWPTFAGAFVLGSCWWLAYSRTRNMRLNVFTHFVIDVFGMAAYMLANKVPVLDLPL